MARTSRTSSSHTETEIRRFKNDTWASFFFDTLRGNLTRHHRPRLQYRIAHRHGRKLRALLEPRFGRGVPPQRLALRVGQRPAQRFEVRIDRQIVAGEQLDAMAIGI